jgi:hypothetical protein
MKNVWTTGFARVVLGSVRPAEEYKRFPYLLSEASQSGVLIATIILTGSGPLYALAYGRSWRHLLRMRSPRLFLLRENLTDGGRSWRGFLVLGAVEPSCKTAPHELDE